MDLTKEQKTSIATAAGVSVRTLDRYLKNPTDVGPDTRAKVAEILANTDGLTGEQGEPDVTEPPAAEPVLHDDKGMRSAAALNENKALKAWEKAHAADPDTAGPRPLTPNYDKVVEDYMTKQSGGKVAKTSKGTGTKKVEATPEPAKQRGFTNVALKGIRAGEVAAEILGDDYSAEDVYVSGTWLVVKNSEASAVLADLVDYEAPGPYAKRLSVLNAVAVMHAFPKVDTDSKAPVYAVIRALREQGIDWTPKATADSKPAFLVGDTLYEKINDAVVAFGVTVKEAKAS